MGHGFLGMEHGGNPAKNHLDAFFAIRIGYFPASLDLHRQHHGDTDEIDRLIKIYFFQVLIDKIDFDIIRQGGSKNNRTMRGQMKLGLSVKLGPLGIYQFKFHGILSARIKVICRI